MSNRRQTNGTTARSKKLLIVLMSVFIGLALALTCLFTFSNVNTPVEVEEAKPAAPEISVSGGGTHSYSLGSLVNGSVITVDYCSAVYYINLPKGTYIFEAYGGAGASNVSACHASGGAGGYTKGTISVTASSEQFTIYTGGMGGTYGSNGNTYSGYSYYSYGGYNGGGWGGGSSISNGSNIYNCGGGGGGRTDVYSGSTRLMCSGGGGGGGGYSNGGTSSVSSTVSKVYASEISTAGGSGGAGGSSGGTGGGGSSYGGSGGGGATTSYAGSGGAKGSGSAEKKSDGCYYSGGGGGGGGGYYGGGGGGGGRCTGKNNANGTDGYSGSSGSGGSGGSGVKKGSTYYGGSGGGGGGGSNYLSTARFYSTSNTTSGNYGHGYVRITVSYINGAPNSRGYSVSGKNLGTQTFYVYSSYMASDPDGNSVYFCNGVNSMSSSGAKLYTTSACSAYADAYLTYSINDTTITITSLNRLPRSGIDGQSNNALTVYARIRDNYSGTASYNGFSVIPFTIYFNGLSTNHTSGNTSCSTNGRTYSMKYGPSVTQSTDYVLSTGGVYSPSAIGTYALTVQQTIKKGDVISFDASLLMTTPDSSKYRAYIVPPAATSNYSFSGSGGTIYDFTSGSSYTSKTGYTRLNINTLKPSAGWQTATCTLYLIEISTMREPTSVTYNGTGGQNIQITFKIDNTRPVMRSTANNVVDVTVGSSTSIALNTYFLDDDEAISSSTHVIKEVKVPAYEFVELNKYGILTSVNGASGAGANKSYYNVAGGTVSEMTHGSTGTSTIPTGFDQSIAVNGSSATGAQLARAFLKYTFTGSTLTLEGVRSSYSQYLSNREGKPAYTAGQLTGNTGSKTFTGEVTNASTVVNPGHFYIIVRLQDNNESDDYGIWLPLAIRVGASSKCAPTNTGTSRGQQAGVSALPAAVGKTGDTFYYTPMAVNAGGLQPIGLYKNNRGELVSAGLRALALDSDHFNTSTVDGHTAGTNDLTGNNVKIFNELVRLDKSVTPATVVTGLSSTKGSDYIDVELIDIYLKKSDFGQERRDASSYGSGTWKYASRVIVGSSDTPNTTTGVNTVLLNSATEEAYKETYYTIKGLKVTLKAATINRYLYAPVKLVDSSGATSEVHIAVHTDNRGPAPLNPDDVATFYDKELKANNVYTVNDGIPTVRYNVAKSSTFIVTPYDLINDLDVTSVLDGSNIPSPAGVQKLAGGFTLNGMNGVYRSGTFVQGTSITGAATAREFNMVPLFDTGVYGTTEYINSVRNILNEMNNKSRAVAKVSKVGTYANATTGTYSLTGESIYADRLSFVRDTTGSRDANAYTPNGNIKYTTTNVNDLNIQQGTVVSIGGTNYSCDFLAFVAKTCTQAPIEIMVTVRDRYGDLNESGEREDGTLAVRIIVDIINTAPLVRDRTAVDSIAVKSLENGGPVKFTIATLNSMSVMKDNDGDEPQFLVDRGILFARTPDLVSMLEEKNYVLETLTDFRAQTGLDFVRYLQDDSGHELLGTYARAEFKSNYEMYVYALGSTQNVADGLYVYFFVTDGKTGGTSIGFRQIEVVNTAPQLNDEGIYGFTDVDNNGVDDRYLWQIVSTSSADVMRERYIVGSERAAELLMQERAAVSRDIKIAATDNDALQNVTLSQRGAKPTDYVNLDLAALDQINTTEKSYENDADHRAQQYAIACENRYKLYDSCVPKLILNSVDGFTSETPGAVWLFNTDETYTPLPLAETGDDFSGELYFYINNYWYKRDDVVKHISQESAQKGQGIPLIVKDACFDAEGRWKVENWALGVRSSGLKSGNLGIKLSIRDEQRYGGDTAGIATAYAPSRPSNVRIQVSAVIEPTVYYTVSGTGIRTNDEYDDYGRYYVIEDVADVNKAYMPTFDDDEDSGYSTEDDTNQIVYRIRTGADNAHILGSGGNVIRRRSSDPTSENYKDKTKAGTNSGVVYNAAKASSVAGAYRYPETIVVPATKSNTEDGFTYDTVSVPMSYFGLLAAMAVPNSATGAVEYMSNYVGYDVGSAHNNGIPYDKGDITGIQCAISISDESREWTGATLADNPYVNIEAVDCTGSMNGFNEFWTGNPYGRAYYNRALSIVTVDPELAEGTGGYNYKLIGFENCSDNLNHFVGNGSIMYLNGQETSLIEHNFGLRFSKKDVRTPAKDLTLEIKLAQSIYDSELSSDVTNIDAHSTRDYRTVKVGLKVENSMLDLVERKSSDRDDKSAVMYDGVRGTYYTDVTLTASQSTSFGLVRKDTDRNDGNEDPQGTYTKLYYTDSDYSAGYASMDNTATGVMYRDYAYFSTDSLNIQDAWRSDNVRPRKATSSGGGITMTNTITAPYTVSGTSKRAQDSVKYYYGVGLGTAGGTLTDDGVLDIQPTYRPNAGKYGSSEAGYLSYFAISMLERGRVMSIMANRQTTINATELSDIIAREFSDDALFDGFTWDSGKEFGGLTQKQLAAIYLSRGMVVEYTVTDATAEVTVEDEIKRAYYPVKLMIYDANDTEWSEASYVAMEFRIDVVNSAPQLMNAGEAMDGGGRLYEIELEIGGTETLNLYNFISDPDIATVHRDADYLVTKTQFENRDSNHGTVLSDIDRETRDYLMSPYVYVDLNTTQNELLRGRGGLSVSGSTENDVIMYMPTASTVKTIDENTIPLENTLSFAVNRRTTNEDTGEAITQFRFVIAFMDNHNHATDPMTFVIKIKNQAPRITTGVKNVTMRAGDSFTILASYYDIFVGGAEYVKEEKEYAAGISEPGAANGFPLPLNDGSRAYKNSATFKTYMAQRQRDGADWLYQDIVRSEYGEAATGDKAFIRDSSSMNGRADLGYLGLAEDDSPWKLRISDWTQSGGYWSITPQNRTQVEGSGVTSMTPPPLALRIDANEQSCNERPFTITLIDGEGETATYTMYITIVSAPPVARDASDPADMARIRNAGLYGTRTSGEAYVRATYDLLLIPYVSEGVKRTVDVDGYGNGVTAFSTTRIALSDVAYDPDGLTQTEQMTLKGDGSFTMNGSPLSIGSDGAYDCTFFKIEPAVNKRSFTVRATGYDPNRAYETVTFEIADSGKSSDVLTITLRVYTVYSDMINGDVAGLSSVEYGEYIAGSNKVYVKPYDEYYGYGEYSDSDGIGKSSVYAYMSQTGNDGNDGNEGVSPVRDPDVSMSGMQTYAVTVYAFINDEGEALDNSVIGGMFMRVPATETFKLTDEARNGAAREYVIGGIEASGLPITTQSRTRLTQVNRYAEFKLAADGASIEFVPNTATLDKRIPIYIEVEKRLGTRPSKRTDGVTMVGTLFDLTVLDSAPIKSGGNSDSPAYDWTFSGVKGDSKTFKIYDRADPFGSLFSDSDLDDYVTVLGFEETDTENKSYIAALSAALKTDPDLDWAPSGDKRRAFTVIIDEAENTLTVRIDRRMDKKTRDGYEERVTFPLVITGTDKDGQTATTVIGVTIGNSQAVAAGEYTRTDQVTGNGYEFRKLRDNEYALDARLAIASSLRIEVNDFMRDADYGSNDSYIFITGAAHPPHSYMTTEKASAKYYKSLNEDGEEVATVTPLFEGEGYGDAIGFNITATNTKRNLIGTVYVRVIDRSGNSGIDLNGVLVQINVTIRNEAPYIKLDKEETSAILVGAKTGATLEQFETHSIAEYVSDRNASDVVGEKSADTATYLRIYSITYGECGTLWTTQTYEDEDEDEGEDEDEPDIPEQPEKPDLPPEEEPGEEDESTRRMPGMLADASTEKSKNSSQLFTIEFEDEYHQVFSIKPNIGYYGNGSVTITVADGDINSSSEVLTTQFTINIQVLYNPEDITSLNSIELACGKTMIITIGTLIPDVTTGSEEQQSARAGSESYNPSASYALLSITPTKGATDYVEIEQHDSEVWWLTAKAVTEEARKINVEYALKSNREKKYTSSFELRIVENYKPELIFASGIECKRYDDTTQIANAFALDTANTVYLSPTDILRDPENDVMVFEYAKSNKPSLVVADITEDGLLRITFNAKGDAKITVEVKDESREICSRTFLVVNNDLPEPSFWVMLSASFESNKALWAILIGVAVLAVIVVVIIISVVQKRKRQREELEALLVSEMAIEDQMLRLAGAPAPTDYQSFGYLQAAGAAGDPSMMLGAGGPAGADPNRLALGAADGAPAVGEQMMLATGTGESIGTQQATDAPGLAAPSTGEPAPDGPAPAGNDDISDF